MHYLLAIFSVFLHMKLCIFIFLLIHIISCLTLIFLLLKNVIFAHGIFLKIFFKKTATIGSLQSPFQPPKKHTFFHINLHVFVWRSITVFHWPSNPCNQPYFYVICTLPVSLLFSFFQLKPLTLLLELWVWFIND